MSSPLKRKQPPIAPRKSRPKNMYEDEDEGKKSKKNNDHEDDDELPKKQELQSKCHPFDVLDFSGVTVENERIHSFLQMNDFLNSLPSDEVGSMGKVFNNPIQFSKGDSATAFSIKINPSLGIASKVMADDDRGQREILYYRKFTENLLRRNGSPHFPLVSRCERCERCSVTKTYGDGPFSDKITVKIPIKVKDDRGCFTLFSELADGDLESIIDRLSSEQVLGMIFQVWMACASLEREGLVHNDLHFGNILYHDEPPERANTGKWLLYQIGRDDYIYVKHTGSLWVLWDFGMMVKNGETENRDGEAFKAINTFTTDIKMTFFPKIKDAFKRGFDGYKDPFTFIEMLDKLLGKNQSIIDVLNKLSHNED